MIRVLVADDDPMVRHHLRAILTSTGEVEVVAEAEDGAEAVEAVLRAAPDVVLMDIRMPGVDGITATAEIARLRTPPVVVALTTFDSDTHVLRALQAGANGFVVKSTPPQDLIDLVKVAAQGATVLSPSAARHLVSRSAPADDAVREKLAGLSERERDVLACLGEGLTNGEIAARLFLSDSTVKSYISRLLGKLDLANRTQAGLLAHQAGLVGP
ncbi:response regulator transcription factor [Nonomuraea sp. KC401]|uniref:Response regulator transcription factor n=1 Tax=Nonomuraea longispora TaxID=1848320 RepID=A0A4R4NEJ0_9ACTN|nr:MULTISPECIES: response regulator transcription factor [Nonomuraea]NBE95551.1 response regulator [Nonomuraea sp. K271]TDC05920.1 response regulator transcription factor [Nonomuraea longispora]TLF70824.1 response regulator transcription factor [Nonomuraea sp. KC401]